MIYIFSDFDGTITETDTLVTIFDNYCRDDWRKFQREYHDGSRPHGWLLERCLELLDGTMEQFVKHLEETAPLREGFADFFNFVKENSIPFRILSGGFLSFSRDILIRSGIPEAADMIEANDLFLKDGRWNLKNGRVSEMCGKCSNCKTLFLREAREKGYRIVYIGDGHTDLCASRESDIVFATGTLKSSLESEGISYIPFDEFNQIKESIKKLI